MFPCDIAALVLFLEHDNKSCSTIIFSYKKAKEILLLTHYEYSCYFQSLSSFLLLFFSSKDRLFNNS